MKKSQHQQTILVVEDDSSMREVEVGHLERLGYEVLQAEDGQQAINLLDERVPDMVLLDLMLPKVDGYGVLEHMRKDPGSDLAKVPVVVLSNLWTDKDILKAKALFIEAYFVKANITLKEVSEKISEVLEKTKKLG